MHYGVDLANALAQFSDSKIQVIGFDCCKKLLLPEVFFSKLSKNYSVKEIVDTCESFKSDIVHFSGFHPLIPVASYKLRRLGMKLVLTLHDLNSHPSNNLKFIKRLKKRVLVNKLSINTAVKVVDDVIFLSSYVAGQAYERFRKNFTVIRLNQDTEKFIKLSKNVKIDRASDKNLKVVFFGAVDKYKGVEYLVDAFQILLNKKLPVELSICGKADKKKLKIPNSLSNRIIVKNERIPDEEIYEIFVENDVVALPYVEVSQSGVLPLAMGFGKAVVASSLGSFNEWIIHEFNGLLSTPRNPLSIAKQIEKCLERDFYEKLCKNALATYNLYNWKSLTKEYIYAYEKHVKF